VRNTIVMIVLALVAAVTWLATWQRQDTTVPAEQDTVAEPLGYYMRGARLSGTDDQGRVVYRLSAERLDESPDDERLQLTGVNVDYQPLDETSWSISAAEAVAPRDLSELELIGNVEIRSSPSDGMEAVSIVTQHLKVFAETSAAESDVAVEIRFGSWQLQAIGFRTHLKGDTLELESQVHATLAP
jgi:lipopolysaccharide export system protein LptC